MTNKNETTWYRLLRMIFEISEDSFHIYHSSQGLILAPVVAPKVVQIMDSGKIWIFWIQIFGVWTIFSLKIEIFPHNSAFSSKFVLV